MSRACRSPVTAPEPTRHMPRTGDRSRASGRSRMQAGAGRGSPPSRRRARHVQPRTCEQVGAGAAVGEQAPSLTTAGETLRSTGYRYRLATGSATARRSASPRCSRPRSTSSRPPPGSTTRPSESARAGCAATGRSVTGGGVTGDRSRTAPPAAVAGGAAIFPLAAHLLGYLVQVSAAIRPA